MPTAAYRRLIADARRALAAPRAGADRPDPARWDWFGGACACGLEPGECTTHHRARANQRPPDGEWRAWLLLMGRGCGKTRSGAEWVRRLAESGAARRIALVGATASDVREVMIEGDSGILSVCPPWARPRYEPARRKLTWPNGAAAACYSAEEPNRLRGPQFEAAWCDELAAWERPAALDNLLLGLRLGSDPRLCITTTPRATAMVKDLVADPTTAISRGTTYDNRAHLAAGFFDRIVGKFKGTRLGDQELMGELIEISEGAWFPRFDPSKHVDERAEFWPGHPIHLAIDCGVSRHVAAVWFQLRGPEGARRVVVIGEWHGEGLYSAAAAEAIRRHGLALCGGYPPDTVRLDPASGARTGVGPAAFGEFARVLGERVTSRWPTHRVADGLDQLDVLLDSGCLVMHPRCKLLRAAFQNYSRARRGADWLDEPADPQHPHEDLMDALRGGVRDRFPEGRIEPRQFMAAPAGRIL